MRIERAALFSFGGDKTSDRISVERMAAHDGGESLARGLAPVSLQPCGDANPRHRYDAGLNHALHGGVGDELAPSSGSINHGIDFIAIAKCGQSDKCDADLGGDTSHNQFLASGPF